MLNLPLPLPGGENCRKSPAVLRYPQLWLNVTDIRLVGSAHLRLDSAPAALPDGYRSRSRASKAATTVHRQIFTQSQEFSQLSVHFGSHPLSGFRDLLHLSKYDGIEVLVIQLLRTVQRKHQGEAFPQPEPTAPASRHRQRGYQSAPAAAGARRSARPGFPAWVWRQVGRGGRGNSWPRWRSHPIPANTPPPRRRGLLLGSLVSLSRDCSTSMVRWVRAMSAATLQFLRYGQTISMESPPNTVVVAVHHPTPGK